MVDYDQRFRSDEVEIDGDVEIDPDARIGVSSDYSESAKVVIGKGTEVGAFSVVEEGVKIGKKCNLGHQTMIQYNTVLEDELVVEQQAQVDGDSYVGRGTTITGFVGENSEIGENCKILGELLHPLKEPQREWSENDDSYEKAPTLGDYVIVSPGAQIIGDQEIQGPSWLLSGAIVTQDMNAYEVALEGVNEILKYDSQEVPQNVTDSGIWDI